MCREGHPGSSEPLFFRTVSVGDPHTADEWRRMLDWALWPWWCSSVHVSWVEVRGMSVRLLWEEADDVLLLRGPSLGGAHTHRPSSVP